MKRLAASLLALLALGALPGCARAQTLVDLQVLDLDRQETLPRHPHRGRDYVEGQPGHRYAVVLHNLTGERMLAVVSVDGVNAISGETAGSQQAGYVLAPWQRMEVRGWRKNLSEVAEFQFTSLGDSYAARTGRPGNVGVIGVAAFRERQRLYSHYDQAPSAPIGRAQGKASAESAAAPYDNHARREPSLASRQQLGTGHGQRRWDGATTTQFERASASPDQVLSIWYDSTQALVARGILPRRWSDPHGPHGAPEAFPIGFAPDP
ncbi:MAG: hypothetical protein K0M70_16050 [Arenimonas sp.]|uniref:hypothetical protein n=1 Tax=Arenimonas sp. TaxID=1872635 RepID=UPI0025C1C2A3|nr:hypothetical protein [Arenimonas sp.]MBW8369351.1 hypothetical protein [Arenimonas sp.]